MSLPQGQMPLMTPPAKALQMTARLMRTARQAQSLRLTKTSHRRTPQPTAPRKTRPSPGSRLRFFPLHSFFLRMPRRSGSLRTERFPSCFLPSGRFPRYSLRTERSPRRFLLLSPLPSRQYSSPPPLPSRFPRDHSLSRSLFRTAAEAAKAWPARLLKRRSPPSLSHGARLRPARFFHLPAAWKLSFPFPGTEKDAAGLSTDDIFLTCPYAIVARRPESRLHFSCDRMRRFVAPAGPPLHGNLPAASSPHAGPRPFSALTLRAPWRTRPSLRGDPSPPALRSPAGSPAASGRRDAVLCRYSSGSVLRRYPG